MKKKLVSSALNGLSDDFILEAAAYVEAHRADAERAADKRRARAAWPKRLAVAACASCLVLAFGVTAVAAGIAFFRADGGMSLTAFVKSAFGNVLPSREAFDNTVTDAAGNAVKTEHYPGEERVQVDTEQAIALLDGCIAELNAGLHLGGYTVILRDFVVDESGIGAFTYEVENPDGLNLPNAGLPFDADAPYLAVELNTSGGELVDSREFATDKSDDGTRAACVVYFTPFTRYDGGALILRVSLCGGRKTEEASLRIDVPKTVKAREMRTGDFTFYVSPLGMLIFSERLDAANASVERLVLREAGGGEYVVIGDGLYNATVASVCGEGIAYAFNRLVDAARLQEILIDIP